jgi:hypothetical protein
MRLFRIALPLLALAVACSRTPLDELSAGVAPFPPALLDAPLDRPDTRIEFGTDTTDAVLNSPPDGESPLPAMMSSIVLWLEARTGVDADDHDLVLRWRDQSALHNDAVPRGNSPTLIRDAGQGHPAVSFGLTGSEIHGLMVADHPSLNWGLSDFWALVVARSRQTTSPGSGQNAMGALFAKTDPRRNYFGVSMTFNSPETASAGLFASAGYDQLFHSGSELADNKPHLFVWRRHGVGLALRVDGQDMETRILSKIVDLSLSGMDLSIGVDPWGPTNQLEGEIYELVFVVAPVLDDQSLSRVESSLLVKYELPQ